MVLGPLDRHTNTFRIEKKAGFDLWVSKLRKRDFTIPKKFVGLAILAVAAIIGLWFYTTGASYAISDNAATLLPEPQEKLAHKITSSLTSLEYNKGYTSTNGTSEGTGNARFSASFSRSASNGVTITDPLTKIDIKLKPLFKLKAPQQKDNRIIYPARYSDAQVIYTLQPAQIKEDIIINKYQGDELTFDYKIVLPSGVEARMEQNGSVGVYSVNLTLLGKVATGNDRDKALLDKLKDKGEKSTLLFSIPAPFINEFQKSSSSARAWFSLKDTTLTLHASGLKGAHYPLSLDPSVYIETAAKLMNGNNESNIDFDVSNELIQKGKTTGGRFGSWTSSTALPAARWRHSTAVYGGYIYAVGGNNGTTTQSTLYWAKFNSTTGTIDAPNPGNGACASWCTSSNYNLPAAREAGSLVAYNGYLYYFGGQDSGGTRSSNVYIAKLGANGEPQLWHPTDSVKSRWSYWYSDTALSSARNYLGAVANDGYMYVVGGTTAGTTTGITTVEKASITPNGTLTNWGSVTSLSTGLFSSTVLTYNNRLYVVGGVNGTTTQNTVLYNNINSDGTLNSWQSTTQISNNTSAGNRASIGGNFATIWGGFLYVAGGCNTMNASGYCTSISNDLQLASINADGSVTDWTTVSGVTSTRQSYGLVAWRNRIYAIGGCSAQNTSTGACTTTLTTAQYGSIDPDGDVSTVSSSVPSGTAPCSGANPYDCDIPPAGDNAGQGGRMSMGTVINNGFIYIIGGCTSVGTNNVCENAGTAQSSGNVSYAAIAADGTLVKPGTCNAPNTLVGSWCVDNTNRVNGTTGISAGAYTVFNNVIYVIGGTSGATWSSTIYRVGVNTDGSLAGAWSSQTYAAVGMDMDAGTGGTQGGGYSFAFTRANPAAASTAPGNLYVIGGCYIAGGGTGDDGIGCSTYFTRVYKCRILTSGAIDTTTTCTTTGQQQLDSETTAGSQGLGLMSGTVYADYVYLIGGSSDNQAQRDSVLTAKIDSSNNIVAVSGGAWTITSGIISPSRRRGFGFGYNGYLYAVAGHDGSVPITLNDILYRKINVTDGGIGTFTTSAATVITSWDFKVIVSNGYAYVLGGCSAGNPPNGCTAMTGAAQTFQIYNNYSGSPKSYSTSANLYTAEPNRIGASAAVLNGKLYIVGGCKGTTECTTTAADYSQSVEYATIADDGSLGTWSTGNNLPTARAWGQLEVAGGTMYYVGSSASDGSASNQVYYTSSWSGSNPTWTLSSTVLPDSRKMVGAASWNNRIYVVGGLNAGGSPTAQTSVYYSSQQTTPNSDISSWTTTTSITTARYGATVIAYANNLYVIGGRSGTTYLNDVAYAKIDPTTGAVGSWTYTTGLPQPIAQADGFAANGFIYLFGGRSADTVCTSNTQVAPISANTSVASGNNPTGLGDWYNTNVKYTGARYGNAAVYYNGKAYVLGGGCGSTLTYASPSVTQSALQSQPQIARYSRMIDTDTNVFPTKWLLNGVDNAIGAHWQTSYRSAYDSYYVIHHATFDQGVNGNAVTENNTAYDNCYGSGTGTNKYSNTASVSPGLSMLIDVPSGTGSGGCTDNFTSTLTRYDRYYIYFTAAPTATNPTLQSWESTVGDTVATLRLTTGRQIQLRDKFTQPSGGLMSTVLETNKWHRLETAIVGDRLYVRLFSGNTAHQASNSDVPTESNNIALTQAANDDFDKVTLGATAGITAPWSLYVDEHKASASFWPSSAFPPWGQATNFGNVTLGTLNTFSPKDSSGANTNYARWYNLLTTISAEQTYGYPEDVTRGPTIADMSLFFTADPSKRLQHGRTFTGGEQQPLDTPKYDY